MKMTSCSPRRAGSTRRTGLNIHYHLTRIWCSCFRMTIVLCFFCCYSIAQTRTTWRKAVKTVCNTLCNQQSSIKLKYSMPVVPSNKKKSESKGADKINEVDSHITQRYEIRKRLGKGVSSYTCNHIPVGLHALHTYLCGMHAKISLLSRVHRSKTNVVFSVAFRGQTYGSYWLKPY